MPDLSKSVCYEFCSGSVGVCKTEIAYSFSISDTERLVRYRKKNRYVLVLVDDNVVGNSVRCRVRETVFMTRFDLGWHDCAALQVLFCVWHCRECIIGDNLSVRNGASFVVSSGCNTDCSIASATLSLYYDTHGLWVCTFPHVLFPVYIYIHMYTWKCFEWSEVVWRPVLQNCCIRMHSPPSSNQPHTRVSTYVCFYLVYLHEIFALVKLSWIVRRRRRTKCSEYR